MACQVWLFKTLQVREFWLTTGCARNAANLVLVQDFLVSAYRACSQTGENRQRAKRSRSFNCFTSAVVWHWLWLAGALWCPLRALLSRRFVLSSFGLVPKWRISVTNWGFCAIIVSAARLEKCVFVAGFWAAGGCSVFLGLVSSGGLLGQGFGRLRRGV